VGFLKQGSPCFDYFFSAGAAGVVVVVVVVPGAAFAEDIGACAGAAGAACSAAGAGASSFFLQPADIARAKPRQRAKEISFFIDDITSLFFRFTVTAHCALFRHIKFGQNSRSCRRSPPGARRSSQVAALRGARPDRPETAVCQTIGSQPLFPTNLISLGSWFVKANRGQRALKKPTDCSVSFLKQGSPCFDYFFSAGAGVVVVVVVVDGAAGALAEDIGACAGAAGVVVVVVSAAGAGASSFFLQPADKARAKPRQSAKEIIFFIVVFPSFLF